MFYLEKTFFHTCSIIYNKIIFSIENTIFVKSFTL
jgi:hypothetical protein